ncbi:condensation domain-containing protein [Nonomuraea sp. NPDC003804]|uniref:condensation domain-containing protein n=1 Tax=Nonomuraea sp. NPDC003804 TaxID=3154547 RepID=UPI0033B80F9E
MNVDFQGPDEGVAPLTWGQRAIWDAIRETEPDDHYFNFDRVVKVPGSRSVPEVLAAVKALVERHGAFRTRLGERREPYQRLEREGRLAVTFGDPPAGRFDYEREWPLRVGLVTDGDRVTHVKLVFCHLAADGEGAEVAVRDLRMLLLGRPPATPAPRPLDLAAWQRGPDGRRAAQAAAAHWEREHRRIAASMFPTPAAPEAADRPPIWRALMRSPALDLAVRSVAAAHGASTSTVLLAAVAELAGRLAGQEISSVLTIVSNRFRRDTTNIVSTLSMEGLFTLETGRPFADALRAARPAALRAYRSAYHDPADRERIVAAESARRGLPVHPHCCFNDMRFADPGPAASAPDEIGKARAETTLTWPLSQDELDCRFCVHVTAEGLSLTADTRYLPRRVMEGFLLDLEDLLVGTATA